MKKLFATFMALVMMLSLMSVTAFANDNAHKITITYPNDSHTYEAYQVFSGDIADGKLTNIVWGNGVKGDELLTELKSIDAYKDCASAADAAEVLAKLENSSKADDFAAVVGKHLNTVAGTSAAAVKDGDSYKYTISVTGDGYYFVKDKDDTQAGTSDAYTKYILKVINDVTVDAKADVPELEKSIVENGTDVKFNNASVGDDVQYKLTSKVPEMDGYKNYIFNVSDTLSKGLTYNDDIVVKIGNKTLAKDTDYTVTITGGNGAETSIRIVFTNFIQQQKGADVVVTYSAKVNENAVIGTEGNPNTAKLIFSNNPNQSGTGIPGTDPTGETPDSKTITYVTGIKLLKVDEKNQILTGAQFKITGTKLNKVKVSGNEFVKDENGEYYLLTNGSYTKTVPSDTTAASYADTKTTYKVQTYTKWVETSETVEAVAYVDANGVLTFEGLSAGEYKITELVAPAGYNLLKEPVIVKINWTAPAEGSETCTWTATADGEDISADTDNLFKVTVVNQSGAELPSTGGIGTYIFYAVGGILVLAAAVLFVTKKRMSVED